MLINLPIESLDSRYTKEWNEWFPRAFEGVGLPYITIDPPVNMPATDILPNNMFLDPIQTNAYKSSQVLVLMKLLQKGVIRAGDVFFFHDLWHPGVMNLSYALEVLGIRKQCTIAGYLHAGYYDPHDLLHRTLDQEWAKPFERALLAQVDHLFLSCDFHLKLLRRSRLVPPRLYSLVGLPISLPEHFPPTCTYDRRFIVFPHRMAPEKQPELIESWVKEAYEEKMSGGDYTHDLHYIKTREKERSKAEYHSILDNSRVAVSGALQETFGISMVEATLHGAIPLVPDRLAYVDFFPPTYRYKTADQFIIKLADFYNHYQYVATSIAHQTFVNNLADQLAYSVVTDRIARTLRDLHWRRSDDPEKDNQRIVQAMELNEPKYRMEVEPAVKAREDWRELG